MRAVVNRRLGQGFIGVGVRGQTVIMLPVWSHTGNKGTELRLRLAPGEEPGPDVLGRTVWIKTAVFATYVVLADGSSVRLSDTACVTDAAMDILQYLADAEDPRLFLSYTGAA